MKTLVPTLTLTILVTAGTIFVPAAQAQNLIQNGSFELPGFGAGSTDVGRQQYRAGSTAITGWTVAGSGDVYMCKAPDIGVAGSTFLNAESGSYYLDLSGSGIPHATIYQDFATTPSASYQLSFYIGASDWYSPFASINVQLTGATLLLDTTLTPAAPSVNINWTLETFSFVANSTTTRLSFVDTSGFDDNTSFVDNVVVVPEPTSGFLLLFGAAACFCRRRLHLRQ
jgi:hypothetical protein